MHDGNDEIELALVTLLSGDRRPTPRDAHAFFTPHWDRYVDDLTGLPPLPPELCKEARKKEIAYFRERRVSELRTINEARSRMGRRPITARRVEMNKGDDQHPNVRSRLAAREIRLSGQDAIFAPTSPLESLRMVLSDAATSIPGRKIHVRETHTATNARRL